MHAIERHNLDHLPGTKAPYAGRAQLEDALKTMLSGLSRVAMEYSPGNAIPYVSRVDAGTIEMVREAGVEVVTSGDLVQRFDGLWDDAAIASHREASDKLYRIKDAAFEAVTQRLRDHVATTEFDIQQLMAGWFADEGLVADRRRTSRRRRTRAIRTTCRPRISIARFGRDELLLLDLWGKCNRPEQRVRGHHVGRLHRPRRAGPDDAGVCRHRRARATRRWTSCRRPRATDGRCAASSWIAPRDR